jgi:hypothetical protein
VGVRTGLNVERRKILPPPGLELRPLCCPARSQSLYRLTLSMQISLIQNVLILLVIVHVHFSRRNRFCCPAFTAKGEGCVTAYAPWKGAIGANDELMILQGKSQTRLDDPGVGVRVSVGSRIFTSPCRPDRLWGPPTFLSNGYQGLFPRG